MHTGVLAADCAAAERQVARNAEKRTARAEFRTFNTGCLLSGLPPIVARSGRLVVIAQLRVRRFS